MAENKGLSHAEIWDDSSLINAWDTALQEYKIQVWLKGHIASAEIHIAPGIQASGGSMESIVASKELLGEVEMKDTPPQELVDTHDTEGKSIAPTTKGQQEVEAEEGEVVQETSQETPKHHQDGLEQIKQVHDQSQVINTTNVENGAAAQKLPNPPPFPPSILANENEALRNLMISWYFAGYYTGLYEGQQQQQNGQA